MDFFNVMIAKSKAAIKTLMSALPNHVFDSMKLSFVFLRHFGSTIITLTVDYLVFILFYYFIYEMFGVDKSVKTFLSIYTSRAIAILVNYTLIRKFAFKSEEKITFSIPLYILHVVVVANLIASLINYFSKYISINVAIMMLFFQAMFYPVNFFIQKKYIFKPKKEKK